VKFKYTPQPAVQKSRPSGQYGSMDRGFSGRTQHSDCQLIMSPDLPNTLEFSMPGSDGLFSELRASFPWEFARWDKRKQAFLVWADDQYAARIAQLVEKYFRVKLAIPKIPMESVISTRIIDVVYIGAAKSRGWTDETSLGWVDSETSPSAKGTGDWEVILPRLVMMKWFGETADPLKATTLFSVLGVSSAATDAEVKSAYRTMSRQWHPDLCKEAGAADRFRKIKEAYDFLQDPAKRKRLAASLALVRTLPMNAATVPPPQAYRSPLRNGRMKVKGEPVAGRFLVQEILKWDQIVNGAAQTLVTFWEPGAESFTRVWQGPDLTF